MHATVNSQDWKFFILLFLLFLKLQYILPSAMFIGDSMDQELNNTQPRKRTPFLISCLFSCRRLMTKLCFVFMLHMKVHETRWEGKEFRLDLDETKYMPLTTFFCHWLNVSKHNKIAENLWYMITITRIHVFATKNSILANYSWINTFLPLNQQVTPNQPMKLSSHPQ